MTILAILHWESYKIISVDSRSITLLEQQNAAQADEIEEQERTLALMGVLSRLKNGESVENRALMALLSLIKRDVLVHRVRQ